MNCQILYPNMGIWNCDFDEELQRLTGFIRDLFPALENYKNLAIMSVKIDIFLLNKLLNLNILNE